MWLTRSVPSVKYCNPVRKSLYKTSQFFRKWPSLRSFSCSQKGGGGYVFNSRPILHFFLWYGWIMQYSASIEKPKIKLTVITLILPFLFYYMCCFLCFSHFGKMMSSTSWQETRDLMHCSGQRCLLKALLLLIDRLGWGSRPGCCCMCDLGYGRWFTDSNISLCKQLKIVL